MLLSALDENQDIFEIILYFKRRKKVSTVEKFIDTIFLKAVREQIADSESLVKYYVRVKYLNFPHNKI